MHNPACEWLEGKVPVRHRIYFPEHPAERVNGVRNRWSSLCAVVCGGVRCGARERRRRRRGVRGVREVRGRAAVQYTSLFSILSYVVVPRVS